MGTRLSPILYRASAEDLYFWCPACETVHGIRHGPNGWQWNGSADAPTFSPSVLVRRIRPTAKGRADLAAWQDAGCPPTNHPEPFEHEPVVCHSFVADGLIQFLGDCTHALAGKTVSLGTLPDWLGNDSGEE